MRIGMLVRDNLQQHPGGDTVQILQTARFLRQRGLQVDLLSHLPGRLDDYDLYHLFHLDRLWENADYARHLHAAKRPAVLSTIYWPPDDFDRYGRTGLAGTIARTLGSETHQSLRVVTRGLMETLRHKRLTLAPLRFRSAVIELLRQVRVILPNSRAEQQAIEEQFGRHTECVVVPNAVDTETFTPPVETGYQRSGVLCVGRIEPRKNQLNLIRAVRATDIALRLIGQTGRFQRTYGQQCQREAGPNVHFLGQKPADQLPDFYAHAKVHACISWYETPGLVNLEAGLCGCGLVVTPGGCTGEYLGDFAHYCQPQDPASIRAALERGLNEDHPAGLREHILDHYTWDKVAAKTAEAYRFAYDG